MAALPVHSYGQQYPPPPEGDYYASSAPFSSPTLEPLNFAPVPLGPTPAASTQDLTDNGGSTFNSAATVLPSSNDGTAHKLESTPSRSQRNSVLQTDRPGRVKQFLRAYKTLNQVRSV